MMAAVRGDRAHVIAPLDEFYADVSAGLERASGPSQGDGVALTELEVVPPVPTTARVLCAGVNYRSHAAEADVEPAAAPNLFARWASTLVTDGVDIPIPSGENGLDWEVELAVIIGAPLVDADPETAHLAILGYTCFNDVSARTFQFATRQWALGKNADRSGPIGPVIVTAEEIGDPYALNLCTRVNGVTTQSANTSEMIFRADDIAAYASRCLTLLPGDVIATGTPEGVGILRDPPVVMGAGDVVEVEIERIGVLRNRIVAREPA
ncbi:MAG: hypothetical protein QOC92_4569 [Acidimicrobiaceae bacterium]|jgi:2-keto-4-pentenoate hydratase/2-oxohepta-3-ene-1,7-dioic acid hydratase in catechol pathway